MDNGVVESKVLNQYSSTWLWLKLLCLTIFATLAFEHSQIDIRISELFYNNGQWLLAKDAQPYAFIFYDLPKALLILLGIYLLIILIFKYKKGSTTAFDFKNTNLNKLIMPFSIGEISYLLIIIILVPSTTALLKSYTHVSCPNHLLIFGGDLPYLNLWQNRVAQTSAKCFPAAHASAGFSLYALIFLPTFYKYRYRIFVIVTAVGWTMGLYKMVFGDHFFSHTLVSMLLSLTIACALASVFFKRETTLNAKNTAPNTNSPYKEPTPRTSSSS